MHSWQRPIIRSGTSLIEVLIASAILLISVAALGTQATVGMRAAERAEGDAISMMICQSVLDELTSTSSQFSDTTPRQVTGFPEWRYVASTVPFRPESPTVALESLQQLQILSVTVWRAGRSSNASRVSLEQVVRVKDTSKNLDVFGVVQP